MNVLPTTARPVNATRPAPAVRPAATPANFTPPAWPDALPDGRRLRRFALIAAMERKGVTIEQMCDTFQVAEWLVRKCRIAGLATDAMIERLTDPKYVVVAIAGPSGVASDYRCYPKHDPVRGHAWRLWRPDLPAYTVSETPHGVHCTCPDAAKHEARGDYAHRCKHARTLIALRMVVDLPDERRAAGDDRF
jgi:hypothetical protein